MKILVTGANGYLGQGIVKELLDKGVEVAAADFKLECVDGRAQKIACDIFEIKDPYTFFGKPDAILHLAWREGFVHYSDAHVDDLPKHYRFIKEMVQSGLRRIAVMGTMHEIGFYEGSIKEGTPCNPVTPYGISKNALKNLAQMLAKQKNITFQWLRGYYIVSNHRNGSSIFSKIAEAADRGGQTEFPFTMGENQYDFIDYEDFCRQAAAAVSQNEINGVIEICSGRPERLADRAERFLKENQYGITLKYGAFPDRPYDSKAIWGDNSKIAKIMETRSKDRKT